MDNLKNSILEGNFNLAKKILKNEDPKEIERKLSILAYDLDNIAIYFLVLDIVFEEKKAFWHGVASTILSTAFVYILGSYQLSYKHMNEALNLEPKNIDYKEGILLFYAIPDKILDVDRAKKIAKEILEVDPNNKTAMSTLESINNSAY